MEIPITPPCNYRLNPVKYGKKGALQKMDNKKDKLAVNLTYDETQVIPLALYEMHMARADRRLWRLCICWALSLIITVFAFIYLWLQYDYSSTEEYSSVYVLSDSSGNVVTSDISPEEVIRILEVLNSGEGTEDQKKD